MKENEIRIDYSDIQMFIEIIVERAMTDDFPIATIDDLYEYMDDRPSEPFRVIARYPNREVLEELQVLLDHLSNETNLLHQAKLRRKIQKMYKEQAERAEELEKERNEYKSALSEIKRFPTYMTKDNYVSRSLKISKRVLRKWDK